MCNITTHNNNNKIIIIIIIKLIPDGDTRLVFLCVFQASENNNRKYWAHKPDEN